MEPDALIEAILFYTAEPVPKVRLGELLDIGDSEIDDALAVLRTKLEGRGIALMDHDGEVTLATSTGASPILERLEATEERALSKSALEVLSIIAYQAPVTSADIDQIRGVNSQSALRQLLMRGLAKRERASEAASYTYTPSIDLLAHLGIGQASELPEYEPLRAFLDKQKTETL
ncbi:MAG: SMC-Scp complex subunit ScpB [Patescibacteria group bacterium]